MGAERDEIRTGPLPADSRGSSTRAVAAPDPARPPLTAFVWRPDGSEVLHTLPETTAALADARARVWVDVEDADDPTLRTLAAALGLHELVADDIVRSGKRAKIVRWDGILQLVAFTVHFDGGPETVELDIVVGTRLVLTSHPALWRPLEAVVAGGRDPLALLGRGTDLVLYGVLDPAVDAYFPVIDRVSDEIDALEDAVLAGHDPRQLERLVRTRRWLLETRHMVSPMRDILDQLAERELPMIGPEHRLYFRDVHGQVVHIIEELDTQREIAGGALDAYLSGVNNSLAEVMKRLTAITAVLAGVGAAAGIFGMSEAGHALGLPTPVGFWLVAALMVVVGVLVFAWFRRIDWI